MAVLAKSKQLRKEVSLLGVYAIATGTTLSAGFFLLPGLAAAEAGPAVILSYMLAAIPLIPAMFCMMELATAMPRAGGTYYFLDRSMGPLVGTIGGLGVWLSLMLKTSFALIGMGAYLSLFVKGNYIVPLAIALAVAFAVVNMVGAKATGSFQTFLVGIILVILLWFVGGGVFKVETAHFNNFFGAGSKGIVSTAGLVYISYVGVTKVASVSEENSAAAEEVTAATEEMSAQVEQVSASAQSLAAMAQTLQSLVDQFKLLNVDQAPRDGTYRETSRASRARPVTPARPGGR